jgi:hemerythrin-like domain-containing protein
VEFANGRLARGYLTDLGSDSQRGPSGGPHDELLPSPRAECLRCRPRTQGGFMLGLSLKKRSANDAVALLVEDHQKVKKLFDEFEKTDDTEKRKQIAALAIQELKVHAALEEEIFYPSVRKKIEDDEEIMNEADEEHHVAKVLIAELESMKGTESHYAAKFIVLAENVRHHIKEEEDEMLPKAEGTDIDFEALGEKMLRRKQVLMDRGVPAAGEERMVAAARGRGDSPAKAAKKSVKATKKR